MFSELQPAPADPILGLMARFREDTRAERIDLGVGVFRDASGRTPIMRAVRAAEQLRFAEEDTKVYQGMAGDPAFNAQIQALALGPLSSSLGERLGTAQTPGGTGALRVAADLIRAARPQATVWLADPSWDNHAPVVRAAGLGLQRYPYLDAARTGLREEAMLDTLRQVPAGDVVLLQASCHNPSGVDIPPATWALIADLACERGFLPLVDMAYQGLGDGLDEDARGLRTLASRVPELLLASSCSKNFGLYRERTGALSVLAESPQAARTTLSVLLQGVRNIYSMPPAHGAAIVARILQRPELRADWEAELADMRAHILRMREALAAQLATLGHELGHLRRQRGMFSFIDLPIEAITQLREQQAIYLLDSGRINLAGLSEARVERFAAALAPLLRG
jgi:aspartate aminotransferase